MVETDAERRTQRRCGRCRRTFLLGFKRMAGSGVIGTRTGRMGKSLGWGAAHLNLGFYDTWFLEGQCKRARVLLVLMNDVLPKSLCLCACASSIDGSALHC